MNPPASPNPARRAGLLSIVLAIGVMIVGLGAYASAGSATMDELFGSDDPAVRDAVRQVGEETLRVMMRVIGVLIVVVGFTAFSLGLWQLRRGGVVSAVLLCVVHAAVILFAVLIIVAALITGQPAGLLMPLLLCVGFGVAMNCSIQAAVAANRQPVHLPPARPADVSPLALAGRAPLAGYYADFSTPPPLEK